MTGLDRGDKLCSSNRHEKRGNNKSHNPREEKPSDTGFSSDGTQPSHIQPMYPPVDHGEEVGEAMAGGKEAKEIQVKVGEVSRRNRNSRHGSMNVGLDLLCWQQRQASAQRPIFLDNPGQTNWEKRSLQEARIPG